MTGRVVEQDGIAVTLRRSARARRITLRVSHGAGDVTLTLPSRLPEREGIAFLQARAGWLRQAVARVPALALVGPGTALPVEGRLLTIIPAAVRAARIEGASLLVPQSRPAGPAIEAFLRGMARERLVAACARHGGTLGRMAAAITLRDTRSRWGSCTHDGRLMFSWRLILTPPEVLDYVAAHEVAHLVHMDHSPAFWAVVAGLCPDWQAHRAWLRQNGAGLHALRFRDV